MRDAPTTMEAALDARYGRSRGPDAILWNDRIGGILGHRTVRAYSSRPLPEGTLETLVAAAQSAPNSCNFQMWSIVAVTDADKRARLAELAGNQPHIIEAPLILLWVGDLARNRALARRENAPDAVLDYLDSLMVAAIDSGIAAQNAVNAAESLGLGTVYIGAMRNDPRAVAELVGLPPHAAVMFGLVVGWPDPQRPAGIKPRLPQSVILHHETYSDADDVAGIGAYDREMRRFQAEQKMPDRGWVATTLDRMAGPQVLDGRETLSPALEMLGLPLR